MTDEEIRLSLKAIDAYGEEPYVRILVEVLQSDRPALLLREVMQTCVTNLVLLNKLVDTEGLLGVEIDKRYAMLFFRGAILHEIYRHLGVNDPTITSLDRIFTEMWACVKNVSPEPLQEALDAVIRAAASTVDLATIPVKGNA